MLAIRRLSFRVRDDYCSGHSRGAILKDGPLKHLVGLSAGTPTDTALPEPSIR